MSDDSHEQFVSHFIRYQDRVYGHICALLPDWRDAEDAFQQTSLILWKRWEEFDRERDFLSWANGIAQNVVRNQVRAKSRDRLRLSDALVEALGEHRLAIHDLLESRRDALAQCLDELSAKNAGLLKRCYSRGSGLHEVADELGLTANALYVKLSRIRRSLFDCINRRLSREAAS